MYQTSRTTCERRFFPTSWFKLGCRDSSTPDTIRNPSPTSTSNLPLQGVPLKPKLLRLETLESSKLLNLETRTCKALSPEPATLHAGQLGSGDSAKPLGLQQGVPWLRHARLVWKGRVRAQISLWGQGFWFHPPRLEDLCLGGLGLVPAAAR